jgi:hypothetical protein
VLKSPGGLSVAVTVLLALCAVTDLLSIAAEARTYGRLGGNGVLTPSEADWWSDWSGLTALFQATALIATAVVFIIWFHRVRVNAGIFAPDSQSKGAGWTIGCWFVPLGNLWIPRQIASEIWEASAQRGRDGSYRPVSQAPVKAWWLTWVSSVILGRFSTVVGGSDIAGPSTSSIGTLLATDAINLAAAVLAILFVRKLTRMQHTRATEGPYAAV